MYWCHWNSGVPTGSMGTPCLGGYWSHWEQCGGTGVTGTFPCVGNGVTGTVTGSTGVTESSMRALGSVGLLWAGQG